HKGFVEGLLLAVQRNPAVPRRRPKDVIRDLDIRVPQIFGRLRPITDLRRIAANIERREEGIELHGGSQAIVSVSKAGGCDHVVSRRVNPTAGAAFRASTEAAIFLALDRPVRSTRYMSANLCARG